MMVTKGQNIYCVDSRQTELDISTVCILMESLFMVLRVVLHVKHETTEKISSLTACSTIVPGCSTLSDFSSL